MRQRRSSGLNCCSIISLKNCNSLLQFFRRAGNTFRKQSSGLVLGHYSKLMLRLTTQCRANFSINNPSEPQSLLLKSAAIQSFRFQRKSCKLTPKPSFPIGNDIELRPVPLRRAAGSGKSFPAYNLPCPVRRIFIMSLFLLLSDSSGVLWSSHFPKDQ